jgi:hypothetical protein
MDSQWPGPTDCRFGLMPALTRFNQDEVPRENGRCWVAARAVDLKRTHARMTRISRNYLGTKSKIEKGKLSPNRPFY